MKPWDASDSYRSSDPYQPISTPHQPQDCAANSLESPLGPPRQILRGRRATPRKLSGTRAGCVLEGQGSSRDAAVLSSAMAASQLTRSVHFFNHES